VLLFGSLTVDLQGRWELIVRLRYVDWMVVRILSSVCLPQIISYDDEFILFCLVAVLVKLGYCVRFISWTELIIVFVFIYPTINLFK
jgi:hypothetical protein